MSADPNTFQHVLGTIVAELDPKPWEYTTPDGATLTVIPAGLRADHGGAEVIIRATASKTVAAELGITTTDMPELIAALESRDDWSHETTLRDWLTLAHDKDGAVALTVDEFDWTPLGGDTEVTVHLPAEQRLPLASALSRALDVAREWEDPPVCAECDAEVKPGVAFCSTRCRNAADPHDTPAEQAMGEDGFTNGHQWMPQDGDAA